MMTMIAVVVAMTMAIGLGTGLFRDNVVLSAPV